MDLKRLAEAPPWERPESTAREALRVLKDARAATADRILAAGLGGDYTAMNDDIAEALLAVVGNGNEPGELRAAAAVAFGASLEAGDTYEFDDPDEVPVSEPMYDRIRQSLQALYADASAPKLVRRRILEGSVRAPQEWHAEAIRAAWDSGDPEWRLSAVFAMGYVRGFAAEILAALESDDEDLFYEAVVAAGHNELDAAWPHVAALLEHDGTEKGLLLVAFDAAVAIDPEEAADLLRPYLDSEDEEIVEIARDAISMARMHADPDAAFDVDEGDEDSEWSDDDNAEGEGDDDGGIEEPNPPRKR
jgi:hypothetical protein